MDTVPSQPIPQAPEASSAAPPPTPDAEEACPTCLDAHPTIPSGSLRQTLRLPPPSPQNAGSGPVTPRRRANHAPSSTWHEKRRRGPWWAILDPLAAEPSPKTWLSEILRKACREFEAEAGGIWWRASSSGRLEPLAGLGVPDVAEVSEALEPWARRLAADRLGRPVWSNRPDVRDRWPSPGSISVRNWMAVAAGRETGGVGLWVLWNRPTRPWRARDAAVLAGLARWCMGIFDQVQRLYNLTERYHEMADELVALRRRHRVIEDHNQMLGGLVRLHTSLMRGLIEHRGWAHLMEALGQFLGCSVALEDSREHPIAATSPPERGESPRLSQKYPIMAGSRLWGYICLPSGLAMNQVRRMAVEEAAMAAALALVQEETLAQQRLRLAGRLFHQLLESPANATDDVLVQASGLGVTFDRPRRLFVLSAPAIHDAWWADEFAGLDRLLDSVVARPSAAGLVTTARRHVVVLVDDQPREVLARLAHEVLHRLRSRLASSELRLAISAPATAPADYPEALQEAIFALTTFADQRLVWAEALGFAALFRRWSALPEVASAARRTLAPLLAQPESSRQKLLTTLEAYLHSGGQLAATAAACSTHVNTVRYRLSRIEALLGARLDDGETRFTLQLALRLWRAGAIPTESGG
ncbi:MAG: helix-turn-helix domain-containing protein [Firmicutes bacterium]|nr:helix-turn-helix domain-containing protein [Alicyclobacillaceae bacterium]MCL6498263.1 helix-turn-helix domain-containing protein [Bacillota bacterium]